MQTVNKVFPLHSKWTLLYYIIWLELICINIIKLLFFEVGTSETQVFDEQSPSGNDYLSEVNYWNHFKADINWVLMDFYLSLMFSYILVLTNYIYYMIRFVENGKERPLELIRMLDSHLFVLVWFSGKMVVL